MPDQIAVPCVNPYLSILNDDPEEVVLSANGKVKKLKCNKALFEEIVASVDGQTSMEDLIAIHSSKYPQDAVKHFMNILVQAEVLTYAAETGSPSMVSCSNPPSCEADEASQSKSIVIVGTGALAVALKAQSLEGGGFHFCINETLNNIEEEQLSDGYGELVKIFIAELRSKQIALVVACPNKASLKWMTALNEACLELSIPSILAYFNGKHFVLGPTVIPWKSGCYGCLVQHRLNFMATHGSMKLSLMEMHKLYEAWPLPEGLLAQGGISWAKSLIWAEIARITSGNTCPEYIQRQIKIPLSGDCELSEVSFSTLTDCPACVGLNKGKLVLGRPEKMQPPAHAFLSLTGASTAKHVDGGLRSSSPEEARALLDKAFSALGLAISVRQMRSKPLDNVLPSFYSHIDNYYNKKFPFIITSKNNRGKGLSLEQAYLSGAFELLERISAEYYGDVEMIRASYAQMEDVAIDVPSQIGEVHCDFGLENFDSDTAIDWIWGYSLARQEPVCVPASMVYLNTAPFRGRFYIASTGGLAAGATLEDAVLQGFYETVEHDAWMLYQANAITPPSLDLSSVEDQQVHEIVKKIEGLGCRVIIKYLKNDLGIPVFRTWLLDENNYIDFGFSGYGANMDPLIALKRSITEAKLGVPCYERQSNVSFPPKLKGGLLTSKTTLFSLHQFLKTDIWAPTDLVSFTDIPNHSSGNVLPDIENGLELLKKSIPGADIVVVNLTRDSLKVPVVRVLSIGLQDAFKPIQCAKPRLFKLPQSLGLLAEETEYKMLYNGEFPH